jgi:two-component system phosphate regulon response regulator PhoB
MMTANVRVLVVDDEPAFLRTVSAAMRVLGFEPLPVADAETALNVLRDEQPNVVLTDVRLPGMTGVELARQIKSDDRLRGTPVLLMSGFGRPLENTGDAFLAKPFHIDDLMSLISRLIERS